VPRLIPFSPPAPRKGRPAKSAKVAGGTVTKKHPPGGSLTITLAIDPAEMARALVAEGIGPEDLKRLKKPKRPAPSGNRKS
jgi:hypothetical protein